MFLPLQLQSSALELGAAAKAVGSAMAQLLAAADQGNESYTGKASRETAKALQVGTRTRNRSHSHMHTNVHAVYSRSLVPMYMHTYIRMYVCTPTCAHACIHCVLVEGE